MIALRQVAELDLSAASGLVQDGPRIYVVADDERFLDVYALPEGRRTARIPLGPGPDLPAEHRERKRLKPDLEALALLPDGQLLAMGSGSAPNRCGGFVFAAIGAVEALVASPRAVDLGPLFQSLRPRFPELNVEGAAVCGPWLRLLQRGNGAAGANAVIDLDLAGVLAALSAGAPLGAGLVQRVVPVALGALDGVPLSFTDASPLGPDAVAFLAAAEDTDDPYEDGACAGSVAGVLDADGAIRWMERVEGRHKLEGLATSAAGTLMVADPDDRSRRAGLFAASRLTPQGPATGAG
jgi:hypothetical protein